MNLTLCLQAPWVKMNPTWYCKHDIWSLRPWRAVATVFIKCTYFFSVGGMTVSLIMDDTIWSMFGALICISLLSSSHVNLNMESYDFVCKIDPDPRLQSLWHSLDTIFEAAEETSSGTELLKMSRMHLSTFCPRHNTRQIFLWDSFEINTDLSPWL